MASLASSSRKAPLKSKKAASLEERVQFLEQIIDDRENDIRTLLHRIDRLTFRLRLVETAYRLGEAHPLHIQQNRHIHTSENRTQSMS